MIFRREHAGFRVELSLLAQLGVIVALTGAVLWMMFFTPIPATHDFFHAARHSIGILACH